MSANFLSFPLDLTRAKAKRGEREESLSTVDNDKRETCVGENPRL